MVYQSISEPLKGCRRFPSYFRRQFEFHETSLFLEVTF